MRSLHTLLAGAIDYAGLFPPAALDMATAVRNYAAYRRGKNAWALGRFIVPALRLAEFEKELVNTASDGQWRMSALAGASLEQDVATIFAFNTRRLAMIDTIEITSSTVEEIKAIAGTVPSLLTTYVEIPLDPDPSSLVAAIHRSGLRAKVRTGGMTPGAFPSSARLARFIRVCATTGVSFKATAGLHHPIRSTYSLTYEPDSPEGIMYGFMNVFVAADVARVGGSTADVTAALEEQSLATIRISDTEIAWERYRADLATIATLRDSLAISFGSCSFVEPLEELTSLGLL
jgi:hypothetical protein